MKHDGKTIPSVDALLGPPARTNRVEAAERKKRGRELERVTKKKKIKIKMKKIAFIVINMKN
jgi:hypothetical protein